MVLLKRSFAIYFLFLLIAFQLHGQQTYQLVIDQSSPIPSEISIKNQKIDSVGFKRYINKLYNALYRKGYITARIDSSRISSDTISIKVNPGKTFKISSLSPGNVPAELLRKLDYRERYFKDKPFNYREIANLIDKLLNYTENNGYAFAAVKLDSVDLEGQNFKASLHYQPGPYITFDSLKIQGNTKIKPGYLGAYLRIHPGKPFEYQKVDNVLTRLTKLPYLKIQSPGYLTFQNNQAIYHLDVLKRKANQLDGIIGVLPNQQENNKLLITGQFNLKLYNMFSSGKILSFNWQRLKVQSQSLDIRYDHPSLLRAPVDVSVGFNLLKEDSTFLNRTFDIHLKYDAGKSGTFGVFINDKTASDLSETTIVDKQFPDVLDFDLTTYGFGFEWNNFSDLLNPRRGLSFRINGRLGNKKIQTGPDDNPGLNEMLELRSIQYRIDLDYHHFFEISKKWLLHINLGGGKIFNDQLFLNDLYRVGGLKTLRGFNENFFFASEFVLANTSLRYYLDELTYVLLFYDQSYIANNALNFDEKDYPMGIGTGINLTTSSGVFSFIYALGRTTNQPLSFNLSKIHFGYTSRF